jgi:hypothetical protein
MTLRRCVPERIFCPGREMAVAAVRGYTFSGCYAVVRGPFVLVWRS